MPTMRSGGYEGANGRRSSEWFDRRDLDGFLHRSWLKSTGVTNETFRGRPMIGICNSWSELVNCNVHLRGLAQAVKRGVLQAGAFPVEFPVMSLGESLMKPTTMLYRNLMAMDVEESIRSYPLDGVVLLTGCDKTNPASILGAASANIPAIVVTGALGLTPPGGAAIPAVDSRRAQLAEAAGRQIVELVERDLKPSDILTH